MILSVHQPQYIPWLGYFDKIRKSDCFVFLDKVQYKPREFQNRNKIRTKDGWIWLSVSVVTKGLGRRDICEVKIDNSSGWAKEHLSSIKAWYGRSEFFGKYFPFFEELYAKRWDNLSDLNVFIIMRILKELSISTPVYFESELDIKSKKTGRIVDICGKLKADTYLSGIGGKNYLDEGKFAKAGLMLTYQEFKHPVYRQQFMKGDDDFIPYMSAIDMLFNEGPGSKELLGTG
jgi:hypothetical protein